MSAVLVEKGARDRHNYPTGGGRDVGAKSRSRWEKDVYGNEVQRLGRPLPVEYLLVDVPASTPLVPLYTFLERKDAKQYFPVENRLIDGHIQDFTALADYLAKSRSMPFLDVMSDFHVLFYLYRMEDMLPMKSQLGPLLEAVRAKDKTKANEWKTREVWETLEELIAASSNHDDTSMSNDVEFVPSGDAEQNWICTFCTFINSRELPACEICNLPSLPQSMFIQRSGMYSAALLHLPVTMRSTVLLLVLLLVCISISFTDGTRKRQRTDRVSDTSSTSYRRQKHGSREQYNCRVRNPSQHIATRLTRYFIFGGMLQAIAEKTGLPRNTLVVGGGSRYQDQTSGRGLNVHAAHVIRVGAIDERLAKKDASLNKALENYLGHTQNVLRAANAWHGVGGAIDRLQSDRLRELAKIDFNARKLDATKRSAVERIMKAFRAVIDQHVQNATRKGNKPNAKGTKGNKKNNQSAKQSGLKTLQADKAAVYCATADMLYANGKAGYDMQFVTLRLIYVILFIGCMANDRRATDLLADLSSSSFDEDTHITRDEYYRRVRDPSKHISTRLVRYFWFGGVLQAISEKTGIARDKLVAGGASQFQDQSSGRGRGIHAAHVIRVGKINSQLKSKSESLNRALENFIGHTQNVVRAVNAWYGVGGAIDRYQSDKLAALAEIDFSGTFGPANERRVDNLIAPFREIIDNYVQTADANVQTELEKGLSSMSLVGSDMLFWEGKAGYNAVKDGIFEQHYSRGSEL
uniref:RanBP2-type domain-containing protein n=1 Tax=Anopheles farauti TaxID=69004 RepID=A0A182QCF1_9DIPT